MTWRDDASKVIQKAINEIGAESRTVADVDELFKHISKEYYPFGERKMWPYKTWLSAIKQCKAEYHMKMFSKPQEPIDYDTGLFNKEA